MRKFKVIQEMRLMSINMTDEISLKHQRKCIKMTRDLQTHNIHIKTCFFPQLAFRQNRFKFVIHIIVEKNLWTNI